MLISTRHCLIVLDGCSQVAGPVDDVALAARLIWPGQSGPRALSDIRKDAAPDFAIRLPALPGLGGCARCAQRAHAAHLTHATAQPLRALLASRGMLQVVLHALLYEISTR